MTLTEETTPCSAIGCTTSRNSGNSYKLALMLTLCGETFEPVWTDFGRWRHAGPPKMARRRERDGRDPGARGRRPNGRTQTAPILPAARREFTGNSAARRRRKKFELLRWLFWDNQKLSGYMATYRFLRTFHAPRSIRKFSSITGRGSTTSSASSIKHVGKNAFMIGARADGCPTSR